MIYLDEKVSFISISFFRRENPNHPVNVSPDFETSMSECVARAGFVEPFNEEHLNINLESKPVNSDSEQVHPESGSVCVKLDPDNVKLESENLGLVYLQSEPVNFKSDVNCESDYSILKSDPVNHESDLSNLRSETVHTESEPSSTGRSDLPVDFKSEFDHEELETVIIEVEPVDEKLKSVKQDSETAGSEPNNKNVEAKLQLPSNCTHPVHFALNERSEETVDVAKPATPKQNVPGQNFTTFRPKNRVQPLYFGPAVPHKPFYKPYNRKIRQKSSATCEDGFFCCLCRLFAKSLRITFRGDIREDVLLI